MPLSRDATPYREAVDGKHVRPVTVRRILTDGGIQDLRRGPRLLADLCVAALVPALFVVLAFAFSFHSGMWPYVGTWYGLGVVLAIVRWWLTRPRQPRHREQTDDSLFR